jgi:hypothetical protein
MKSSLAADLQGLDDLAAEILDLQLTAHRHFIARPLAEWGISQVAKAKELLREANEADLTKRADATWHWAQARLVRDKLAALLGTPPDNPGQE